MPELRLHSLIERTSANGPGIRACVWVQGCTLACVGCFNPMTHERSLDHGSDVVSLAQRLCAIDGIEGVTMSGGEPLQQPQAVLDLARLLRATSSLSLIIFTGYDQSELQRMPCYAELVQLCDVIIAGRYRDGERVAAGLIGSANKHLIICSDRYTLADFVAVPPSEVVIMDDGSIVATGINPLPYEVYV
ncbi:MAG: radical SAM protein [Herpetosiphon sp.]|nr:radical SAM protein [Herpetosiphon sp.]